jgi:hypothetical protein
MPKSFWSNKDIKVQPSLIKKATEWLGKKTKEFFTIKGAHNPQTEVQIGKMYAFRYDPKWKEVLPLYDTQPLVVVIEKYKDGFLGLNLHYLPPRLRFRLLQQLIKTAVGDLTNEKDKMILSYRLLKSVSKAKLFEPTIHRYLYSHVKTKFSLIHPQDWQVAIFLPTARFKKKKPY